MGKEEFYHQFALNATEWLLSQNEEKFKEQHDGVDPVEWVCLDAHDMWVEINNELSRNTLVTNADINKAYEAKLAYFKQSFAAFHDGAKTQAAHSEGFDDGWQAALTVFSELCPQFNNWCKDLNGLKHIKH